MNNYNPNFADINRKLPSFARLVDLMSVKYEEQGWIVDKLIPKNSLIVISGAPASFKTWFILQMAINISSGTPFLEKFNTLQTNILIVDEETRGRYLQQRFNKLSAPNNLPISILTETGFKLTAENAELLIKECKEKNIGLVFFDSLIRISSVRDENNATDMAKQASIFQTLIYNGLTVIFTHHNRKTLQGQDNPSQDMRGSSDILASVDCHLALKKDDKEITVTQTKLRQDQEINPFYIKIETSNEKVRLEHAGEKETKIPTTKRIYNEIIEILSDTNTPLCMSELKQQIKNKVPVGSTTIKNSMSYYVNNGMLSVEKGSRNKKYVSLPSQKTSEIFE